MKAFVNDDGTYSLSDMRNLSEASDTLLAEVEEYPAVMALARRPRSDRSSTDEGPTLLVPFRWASPVGTLELFTTLTTFGTPRDVTLDELAVELFYPADDATARILSGVQLESPT